MKLNTTDKIIISAIILIFAGLIISIINTSEKQKNCGNDVKAFCESSYMIYKGKTMNKHICEQTLIRGYKETHLFTCEYDNKNNVTMKVEGSSIQKMGEKNETN